MTVRGKRRHTTRWVAGFVLVVLAIIGVVLATRTPQEATAVQSPLVGHMAPQFSGADIQSRGGAPVSLRSLRGHYVFVNFFASWCGPCQQEAPDFIAFDYQNAPKEGADLVSVVFHDQVGIGRGLSQDPRCAVARGGRPWWRHRRALRRDQPADHLPRRPLRPHHRGTGDRTGHAGRAAGHDRSGAQAGAPVGLGRGECLTPR